MTASITIPKGRVRAPFMGVPVPGERPVVLATEQAKQALAGVCMTDVAVIETPRAEGGHFCFTPTTTDPRAKPGQLTRALEVVYTHSGGGGRTVFYDRCQSNYDFVMLRGAIRTWAIKQRAARARISSTSPRDREIAVQIRRLEKEKQALYLHRPRHPLLPSEYHYDGKVLRENEWRWHAEKPQRKRLAQIAGMVLRHKITGTTGYTKLREAGMEFVKFSGLRTHDRQRRGWQDAYWKHLHEFCRGLLSDPRRETPTGRDGTELAAHAEARLEYVAALRESESLDVQIASLRDLGGAL